MSEPILRIPLSEAEAHRKRLTALETLVAKLEAENAELRAATSTEPSTNTKEINIFYGTPSGPCCCGCDEVGKDKHWSVSAEIGDSKGGVNTGFASVEHALCWVVEKSAGHEWMRADGTIRLAPYDRRTFRAAVAGVPLSVDADGNWSAGKAPKAKAKRAKLDEVLDDLRAALTRAVVAEQWAVAISFWWVEARDLGLDYDPPFDRWTDDAYAEAARLAAKNLSTNTMVRHFARFPSAAAVVAERMGDP